MWIAGAAPPDVAARIAGLGLDLGVSLSRAFARHSDLNPSLLLEGRHHGSAPFFLHATIERQLALRPRRACDQAAACTARNDTQCDPQQVQVFPAAHGLLLDLSF